MDDIVVKLKESVNSVICFVPSNHASENNGDIGHRKKKILEARKGN